MERTGTREGEKAERVCAAPGAGWVLDDAILMEILDAIRGSALGVLVGVILLLFGRHGAQWW
jgi:hypothetical protein